jgi:hypothetical protein
MLDDVDSGTHTPEVYCSTPVRRVGMCNRSPCAEAGILGSLAGQ